MPTQLGTNQLKDECVTVDKLNDNALRPVDGGVLSNFELTFGPEYRKKYSLTVNSNIVLSLAASGNLADSWIIITATGDGVHDLDFPSEWRIISGVFNPDVIQRIELYYDGTFVFVTIISLMDVITATLTSAEVLGSQPTLLNLGFNSAVIITTPGWTLVSDGGTVNPVSVTGSGTANPVFTLDREIEPGETVTISYNSAIGNTVSSTGGTELASISNFAVTTEAEVPPDEDFTITVGPSGQDFTTITAANAAAVSGDIIGIKAGTYRESIVAKSGVQYRNFAGETAIVSGLELIGTSGWTAHDLAGGKAIYKKTITLPITGFAQTITSNTSILANQIFKDGDMQIQARWPKVANKDEMFDMYKFRHHSSGTGTAPGSQGNGLQPTSVTDTGLSTGTWGSLQGGTIFITGWYQSATRTISGHSGNVITFPAYSTNSPSINVNFRKWFYITNKLALLTQAKEWHYEGGILYYWQTGGGTPSGTLEHKARNWGFDLSGKTGVIIKGLHFVGCEVRGDINTTNCTIDGIRASYTNHVVMVENNWERHNMEQTGFRLIGVNNTITNSEFQYGASQCIMLGNSGKAINNLIHHYGYEGNYGCGVGLWGNTGNGLITRNSIYAMGRSCIDASMTWNGSNLNWEMSYNDMYDYCKINNDGGAWYTARMTNTNGLNFHHNWIHDSGAKPDPQGIRVEGILAAIYMDQGTGQGTFHHNLMFKNWENMPNVQDRSDSYILSRYSTRTDTTASFWYNNTFASDLPGSGWSYITYIINPQDIQKNNIYTDGIVVNWGGNETTGATAPASGGVTTVSSSILQNQTPVYIGAGTVGLDYRPASGSALQVNAGVVIAGITDGHVGANPDIGAYEWGGVDWVPGYAAVVGGSENFVDATPANVTYSGTWTLPNATQSGWFGNTISYSNAAASTATFTRSGTRIKIYAERMATHGTGTITLDGGTPVAVSFNTAPLGLQVLIWDSGVISAGSHTVVLTCTSGFVLFDYYTYI